ncbi:MAG: carboxylesterase family protein [Bacilli bacterium]|nr:carboxylesterase family protein [Bacilli bacterium]
MEEKRTRPIKGIFFWIFFPLISLIITALLLFYLDMANGPLVLLIIECIVLAACIVARILLRGKRFVFRLIPLVALILANAIILPLAKPGIRTFNAVRNSNPEKTEVLEIANGKIQGVYNEDKSVQVYAGIPYAEAPVGDLRWKEPQDVKDWDGVKDCSKFAARAMQTDGPAFIDGLVNIYSERMYVPNFNMEPLQNMSEDCLYLNVWKPNTTETNLPILIYIHGGSLTSGSSASKDVNGEEMAKKGVIMVTIQYRLGVFGYFAHPSLQAESENGTTGNYGLLDQIKAIEFVSENAEYFGGDKDNITIAGESAGSSSVSAVCSSPLAKGLFKRAIGESSSLVVKQAPHTYRKLTDALDMGADIMKEFDCKNIEDLRKISAEKLVKTKYTNSSMTLDGYALTKNPYDVYLAGENNEEALLNGYNVLEADAFVIPQFLFNPTNKSNILSRLQSVFGNTYGQKFYDLYKDEIEEDAFTTFNHIFSIYWFMQPHYSWSNLALNNGETVYSYQFTKTNHYRSNYHAGELTYAYGNVKNDPKTYRFNDSDKALSETMLSYWSNFAKNGDPNGEGLPAWSPYNNSDKKIMELGVNVGPIEDINIKGFDLVEEYISSTL